MINTRLKASVIAAGAENRGVRAGEAGDPAVLERHCGGVAGQRGGQTRGVRVAEIVDAQPEMQRCIEAVLRTATFACPQHGTDVTVNAKLSIGEYRRP